jgi:hypothetical protein
MAPPYGRLYTLVRTTLDEIEETLHCVTEHDTRRPDRWLVKLANAAGSMMFEVIFENGGIVSCVLNVEGIDHVRVGRIMNAIVNKLDYAGYED